MSKCKANLSKMKDEVKTWSDPLESCVLIIV